MPTRFVEQFRDTLPLQILEPPFEAPELPVAMLWHERTHRNPAMVWLRELIRSTASGLDS